MRDISPAPHLVRFESFEVDLRSGELRNRGEKIKLPDQSFQILSMLLERPREVVLRGEIQKRLWPNDTVVEFENSIHAAIRRLRLALGDRAEAPRYIETLARRGYRWMLPPEKMEVIFESPRAENATVPMESPAPNLIGKKVSHFRALQVLGGGGMGVVYAAEDLKLGRRVALKFLPEELTHDASSMQRFEREARAASALNHPNICTIYGVEEHEDHPFIAMEMLEGQTLRELISSTESQNNGAKKTQFQLQSVLNIALQIVEGLDAAHRKGIVHRDIKPANVFVTTPGMVKLLDFGLAKQQGTDFDVTPSTSVKPEEGTHLSLTRTGATVGTAGYMSPEQIRGEKLDARTDLFSFGLVLYETAVGQRAFTGATVALLHDAILHHDPPAVRELNPKIPGKLQAIIAKALEKDRTARYQTAAEIRTDLEWLRRERQPERSRRRQAVAMAATALFLVSVLLWNFTPNARKAAGPGEIRLRQLTANSAENHVISGAISFDGKYLAYSDIKGLHIKLIDSGETRDLSQPGFLQSEPLEWEWVGWFPDGKRLLANSHPSGTGPDWYSPGTSIWIIPAFGGPAQMLRENASGYAVSPDGSQISFGTNKGKFGDREIWLMQPTGDQARKVFEAGENRAIGQNGWSPDGTRMMFPQIDEAGVSLMTRDLKDGPAITVLTASEMQGINSFQWLPDGRLFYSVPEPGAITSTINFWAMRLDAMGKPIEKPRRVTNLTGFGMVPTSVSQDSKRLAFLQWAFHATVYVADLHEDGTRISNARHVTLTESQDVATDWTADSKAIVLLSNRTGRTGIYKQSPEKDASELLVEQAEGVSSARVSPDGKWILYLSDARPAESLQLKKVPIAGGASEYMFPVKPGGALLCSRMPSSLCVMSEPSDDGSRFTLTAIDPNLGRGSELTRFALEPGEGLQAIDLSPDGKLLAVLTNSDGPIKLFSRQGRTMGTIRPRGLTRIQFLHWAANGRGIYVTTGEEGGRVLWHVDLRGSTRQIWKNRGGNWALGIPSPNGRYLAIESSDNSQNMWMMEKF